MNHVVLISDYRTVRTQLFEQLMRAAQEFGYTYDSVWYLHAIRDVNEHTTPIFMRSCHPGNLLLMEHYKACNIPYIYYMDDNLWELENFQQNPDLVKAIDELVTNASCVIVNSDLLADYVRKLNPMVEVLPAFYDFSMLDFVEKESHPNEIRIGFPSCEGRLPDIEPLVPVIQHLKNIYGRRIAFEFAGVIPKQLRGCEGVRYFSTIRDYEEYSRFQFSRGWDIGLAPLRPTQANFSKTNNKYREFGACGTAGVYADAPPYACVRHRHTGLLVDTSEEAWFAALSELIEDSDLRRSCGEHARQDVLKRFSVHAVLPEWMQAIDEVSSRRVGSFRRVRLPRSIMLQAQAIRVKYNLANLQRHLHQLGVKGTLDKLAQKLSI